MNRANSYLLLAAVLALTTQSAVARHSEGDPLPEREILAQARFRVGDGAITIVRVFEDGFPAIGIKQEGRIGDEYRPRREWANLAFPERAALMFEDATGERLPDAAIAAMLDLEELRAKNDPQAAPIAATAGTKDGGGKPLCPNLLPPGDEFLFDCNVRSSISKTASKPDDVCLLTAALHGNHTQEISYKSTNGNFYENHESDVLEGHYVAYLHRTGIPRTRKGQIFNASSSDKSRFEFWGDTVVEPAGFPLLPNSDCLILVH